MVEHEAPVGRGEQEAHPGAAGRASGRGRACHALRQTPLPGAGAELRVLTAGRGGCGKAHEYRNGKWVRPNAQVQLQGSEPSARTGAEAGTAAEPEET
ncbi:hypothetical protein rosag_11200 [Roseisolibacter agri]|uniref:Uncharacterized protein n=1 Tax=Roseisolibacter agri TaxID=2014610 RepID=A0AA37Q4T6_9BACT|nr:hypothetical protein rosag_11200 [Roseisolibacter agri]